MEMRVLFYLDSLLLLAQSREEAVYLTMKLVSSLAFTIIGKKSSPLLSRIVVYLGALTAVEALTCLSCCVRPHNVVTALPVMQLLGLMSAAHVLIPLDLLLMRWQQRWFICLRGTPC